MHGNYQRSMGRRILWQVYHFFLVSFVFWLLFAGGLGTTSSWFGTSWIPGDLTRRILVFLTFFILFLRWGLTNFYLLKRTMPWAEIIVVCIELSLIHTTYARPSPSFVDRELSKIDAVDDRAVHRSPDILWFYWPLLGWGIGIVMHAVYVFGFGHWFGPDWEEKTQYDLVAIQISSHVV